MKGGAGRAVHHKRRRRACGRNCRGPPIRGTAKPPEEGAEPPEDRIFKAGSFGGAFDLFCRVYRRRAGRHSGPQPIRRVSCLRRDPGGNGYRLLFVESKGGKRCEDQAGEPDGDGGNTRGPEQYSAIAEEHQ